MPVVARYVSFSFAADPLAPAALPEALKRLAHAVDGEQIVVGIGPTLVAALGASVPGLHEFMALAANGVEVPSTPIALWCWLRGEDRGDLLQMRRMAGQEDGVVDAMFRISKPVTGAYLWCPPLVAGRLDLRQLEL